MITKKLNTIIFCAIITLFLIGFTACERDFKDIGIALVDNNKFDTNKLVSSIITYNKSIDSVRVDSLPEYVLGVNLNNTYGKTTASIAAQLSLPITSVDFGTNPTIDSVILDLPYYNTRTGVKKVKKENSTDSIVVPVFRLDSIYGSQTQSFTLTVSELGTFLNSLDPLDPSKRKTYYSNKTYNVLSPALYTGTFTPNANDTVAYIKHKGLDGAIFAIDTIKRTSSIPSIKLPLNENFFLTNFVNKSKTSIFTSFDEFSHFFRGLYIEASGSDGSLITMPLANGSVNIFYSNDVSTTDASNVTTIKRTKQTMIFPLSGIKTNKYEHNYNLATSSIQSKLLNPDITNGEDKLYVQGASGSLIVLKLFENDDIALIRSKNWLINEANIKLYIDKTLSGSNLPNRLYIYNYDDNAIVTDLLTEGATLLDGTLHYDTNGDPEYYKFRITDYISSILKANNSKKISKLAIKSFSSFDIPQFTRLSDTIAKPFNWNPKGVAVYGNKEMSIKKPTLEIFYTELKN